MRLQGQVVETNSIEDHARLLRGKVDESLADPHTRHLAAKIVSSGYDAWVDDPRTGTRVPAIKYYDHWYRVTPGHLAPPVCDARDRTCEITAIWNFMVLNVRYTGDVDGYDSYQDLRTTLMTHSADCDDATVAFAALLRAVGFQVRARIISQDGRYWSHVYPVVKSGNTWVALDMTEKGKKPGWEFRRARTARDFDMGAAE